MQILWFSEGGAGRSRVRKPGPFTRRIARATSLTMLVCLVLPLLPTVAARAYTQPVGDIDTRAGGAAPGPSAATSVALTPTAVAVRNGVMWIVDETYAVVRRVDLSTGLQQNVAGDGIRDLSVGGGYGDGGPATSARLVASTVPGGIAVDGSGNVYVSDASNHRVRRVSATGTITTIAGNGTPGYSGDGGLATNARLSAPRGLTVDSAGNLYIADAGNGRVRRISTGGVITTVAGNGTVGSGGDGGLAINAQLRPAGLAVDDLGSLFIADEIADRVRRVNAVGVITTIAGNGASGYSGDGGLAVNARLWDPLGLAVDSAGNLYIAEWNGARVRQVNAVGVITTMAGTGAHGFNGDGGPAANAQLSAPQAVVADSAGNLYIGDTHNHRVRRVDGAGTITTVAGNGTRGYSGDGGPATNAQLDLPWGLASDPVGNLYIADANAQRIRRVGTNGIITTVAGNGTLGYSGDGGPATNAQLYFPAGLAIDGAGNLYFTQLGDYRVRRVDANGTISTVAGNGTRGYSGDGGAATNAQLDEPTSVAVDGAGNVYVTDERNSVIRRVDTNGVITTVAGTGTRGFSGDGGPATAARLLNPYGVTADSSGGLYIADSGNRRIRRIDANGIITTIAGIGTPGYSGDGGPATDAELSGPTSVSLDLAGNVFVSDLGNAVVRRIDTNGTITTVAGDGNAGHSGDRGPATNAQLDRSPEVEVDSAGNIYVAGDYSRRVRKVKGPGSGGAVGLSPAPVDFGAVVTGTPSGPATVTVTNLGFEDLVVTAATIGGSASADYAVTANRCGAPVAPSGTCTIDVTFTPTAVGTRAASLALSDNGLGGTHAVALSGTGEAPNAAPVVTAVSGPVDPVSVGTQVAATATFTDAGSGHTAIWTWGDGAFTSGTVTTTSFGGRVAGTHAYTTPGIYTVTVTVTDSQGASGSGSYSWVTVYDPNGGFVVGGGSFHSPPGAWVANPALTGPGQFATSTKYQAGGTTPTGNTRFNAPGVDFRAVTYQVLMVTGPKAILKGAGTVNGAAGYDFTITMIDGQASGGGGVDRLRIKITRRTTGLTVYDNQPGAADTSTAPLSSGTITIQ